MALVYSQCSYMMVRKLVSVQKEDTLTKMINYIALKIYSCGTGTIT